MAKRTRSGDTGGLLKCDQYLTSCAFEEETWSPCVAWVVGRQPEDFKHIEALNVIIQTGVRKLFSVITKEQLCIDVRELGNSKVKKVKEVPPYSEICEVAKVFLEAGETIPTPLMAKLIKWKMLLLKEADVKRRAAENKSASEKKKGKEKDASKERARSPKKGDKKQTEGQHAKEGSKMKKRGEDDDERKYIDDEPEDGAQYYFIITGFHDPYLFQFLEVINVNVSCIISVTSQFSFKDEDEPPVVDEKLELFRREVNIFWRDLVPLLQRQPDTSTLHDIARLDYEVSYLTVPTDPLDPEQRVSYSSAIFEDIALMLYNLTDARRMYYTYLANLKLIHVPLIGHTVSSDGNHVPEAHIHEKGSLRGVDMRYYNDLMNTIPNESASVALIMHCMLEQVVATEKGIDPPSEQAISAKTDGINAELSAYLGEMTGKLGLTAQEHEALSLLFDIYPAVKEKSENPKLININDEICIRTHHLEPNYGFNAEEAERKMLQLLPISKYCHMSKPSSVEARNRASRFQELFHHCASLGLPKSETDHALKQLVFECMELTKCDRNGFPLQKFKEGLPQQPIPWDDPFPYFKFAPLLEKSLTEIVPSPDSSVHDRDERDEEVANLHPGHSGSSVGRPKLSRFSEAQRKTCNTAAEKIYLNIENIRPSESGAFDFKKGIMVKPTESHLGSLYSQRYSATNSVRFDVPSSPKELEDLCQDVIGLKKITASLTEITETQQRNLDTWCFAEHYKPNIFLQVLQEATYNLPFIEVYQENREDAMMLVLHNPYNRERQNHSTWHNELHSNTGFRNYLENTVESIQSWLKIKEAEYKAEQMSKEAASIQKDEEEKQKAMEKTDKKGKRSPQRSAKSKSPGVSSSSSADRQSNTFVNPYIRQGSIKAWQAEQMRLANEEDEKEKNKSERRIRSAQKIKEKQDKEKEKTDKLKRGGSRHSQNKQDYENMTEQLDVSQTDINLDNHAVDEASLPFFGYDTGNQLIHMLGTTSTLFPCDGGTIHTERIEVIQGSITVRSVVKKDGHIFAVHIINPREDMNLPEEYAAELDAANSDVEPSILTSDRSEKEMLKDGGVNLGTLSTNVDSITSEQNFDFKKNAEMRGRTKRYACSQFGSITAHLSDGMVLAISQFGPSGESYLQPYEPPVYIQPVDAETQLIMPVTPTKSKTKGNAEVDKEKGSQEIIPEETEMSKVKIAATPKQEFQELHVTCPDGLAVKYFLQSVTAGESNSTPPARHLMVRQSYPFKTSGLQSCEGARNKYIQSEVSRVITADGNVIKNMVDGSIEVLGSDGTLSVFTGTWYYGRTDSAAHATKHSSRVKKGQKGKAHSEASGQSSKNLSPHWTITYPNGERLQIIKDTGNIVELTSLPVCVACDPETKQIMCTRDDHVIVITYPDGGTIVEHADGTRISTYYKDITVLDEAESPSPRNYIQTMKFIKVECPAFATVEFNTATSENLTVFGNGTNINVFPDGYYMFHHNKGGRIEIDTEGTLTYFPQRCRYLEHLNSADLQYLIRHNADVIVETIDPNGNVFNVRSNGESVVIPAITEDLFTSKSRLRTEEGQLGGSHDHHAPRFFIVHDDCSGTELLRYENVAEYLLLADQNPAAAVLSEEIPNHPGVTSITVLKPYLSGISEKWLKKYDQDSIVPQGLRCRDLKTIPAKEYKKPGPVFGTNVGKGLSIGTNIQAPAKIPILKCPEKLEMRHLLQFPPVTDELREKLISALHQFATEVVARMKADNLMSIEDPRSQEEKLSALELKMLADSLKRAAKKYESEHVKTVYEQAVAPPPPCLPSKPPPKRAMPGLEQDRMEKEDEEAKRILRKRMFEPYFESELGKVFTDKVARGLVDDTQNKDVGGVANIQHSNSPYNSPNQTRHDHKASLNFKGFADFKRSFSPSFTVQSGHKHDGATEKRTQSEILPHNKQTAPIEKSDPGFINYLKDEIRGLTKLDAHGSEGSLENETQMAPQTQHYNSPVFKKSLLPSMNKNMKKPPSLGTNIENIPEDSARSSVAQSFRTDVYGKSRLASDIILPVAIQGGKPGAQPNLKFTEIEEPVRQKVKTSSVAGANVKSIKQLKKMRGLIVYPQRVDFGTLIEGNLYTYLVTLTNTGIDACRFKVRRPPLSSGLTVKHTAGSVAAGMSVDMNLELYAIASDKDTTSRGGNYSYTLQIVTETDFLELLIVANILTSEEYNNPNFAPHHKRRTSARILLKSSSQTDKQFLKKDIAVA